MNIGYSSVCRCRVYSFLAVITVFALLAACGPEEEEFEAVPTYTNTPLPPAATETTPPTDTPLPIPATDTAIPTDTPFILIPTDSPVPSDTPMPLLPTDTAAPTDTMLPPEPTATVIPTDTPAPSDTPEATSTPVPSDTPIPIAEAEVDQKTSEIPLENVVSDSGQVVIATVYNSGMDEWAVVANHGENAVNISGWRLYAGDDDQNAYCQDYVLEPGAEIIVSTKATTGSEAIFSFKSSNNVWNNSGDCGYLYDAQGVEVSSYCYGNP